MKLICLSNEEVRVNCVQLCPAVLKPVVKWAPKSDILSLFISDYDQKEVSACSSNKEKMEDWGEASMKVEVDHKSSGFGSLLPLTSL